MDSFVEQMLKSAKETKKKPEPHTSEVDPEEIEKLTKEIQKKC